MASGAIQTSQTSGALVSSPISSVPAGVVPTVPVRLDSTNFMLWKGLALPNLSGAGLRGHLDGTDVEPPMTIKQGTGDE
jgi:hypothetical protein